LNFSIDKISLFVFDFDGVLTNNFVYLDETGKESVRCSRSDGLAFDVLHRLGKTTYILSTEKSLVVEARAKKLNTSVVQGSINKVETLKKIAKTENCKLQDILFVGNDVNDYYAMQLCGYRICPVNSHIRIKEISQVILKTSGGNGVVRELLEEVLGVDFIKTLYS
jgi:YrbI family 3-deoxy-D-manno-octulosonate 8-phosphate phosphatase